MLVTFRSRATEPITMFHDVALHLIKMMGASGRIPSALSADEVASAAKRLRAALHGAPAIVKNVGEKKEDEDDEEVEVITLPTRAVPLLDLLDRAAASHADVMWEAR
ncbi:MAG TPA: DUF1840 domain-containing protein [Steroidobacteraceae bacterium]|nr:DUF1840 domain-containing protein [Steroidobacteraceae bacterium]